MKEEIEKRRAEAAEKRQKVDDAPDGEGKPFKCVSPRGSSLKVSSPSHVGFQGQTVDNKYLTCFRKLFD